VSWDEETFAAFHDMPDRWYEDYERGRPSYPLEVVDVAGLPSSATVLDLGAGTGKLTRVLVEKFARVFAVEPDIGMRRLLVPLCPEAEVFAGTADHIPIEDGSIDAVFAAQAFHWFDNEPALAEIVRVLRAQGALVLMWNVPAGQVEPSIAAVEQLLKPRWPEEWGLPLDLGKSVGHDWRVVLADSPFGELQQTRLPNPQTVDPEQLIAFFESMGWICDLLDEDRLPLIDEIRPLLTAPVYRLPWETHVYWTRLAGREAANSSGG
jgi:SAM-dependent methyltransferase